MTLHNSSKFSFWNVVKVISKAFVINHFGNPESLIFIALTNILERHHFNIAMHTFNHVTTLKGIASTTIHVFLF